MYYDNCAVIFCCNALEIMRLSSPFALEREKMFAHDREDIGVGQSRSSTSARVVSEVKELLKLGICRLLHHVCFGGGQFFFAQIVFDM